jgi:hypothetical protein
VTELVENLEAALQSFNAIAAELKFFILQQVLIFINTLYGTTKFSLAMRGCNNCFIAIMLYHG